MVHVGLAGGDPPVAAGGRHGIVLGKARPLLEARVGDRQDPDPASLAGQQVDPHVESGPPMRAAWSAPDAASPVAAHGVGVGDGDGLGEGLGDVVVTGVVGVTTVATGVEDAVDETAGGSLQAAAPKAMPMAMRQVRTRAGRRMVRSTLSGVG